jgi:hypothetical protein
VARGACLRHLCGNDAKHGSSFENDIRPTNHAAGDTVYIYHGKRMGLLSDRGFVECNMSGRSRWICDAFYPWEDDECDDNDDGHDIWKMTRACLKVLVKIEPLHLEMPASDLGTI